MNRTILGEALSVLALLLCTTPQLRGGTPQSHSSSGGGGGGSHSGGGGGGFHGGGGGGFHGGGPHGGGSGFSRGGPAPSHRSPGPGTGSHDHPQPPREGGPNHPGSPTQGNHPVPEPTRYAPLSATRNLAKWAGVTLASGDHYHRRRHWPIAYPPVRRRRVILPTYGYWESWDLFEEVRYTSQWGFLPIVALPADVTTVQDWTLQPQGWKGYGFVVPAHGKLTVSLHHPNVGWFRLLMMDRWGNPGRGMIQDLHPKGDSAVSYENPTDKSKAVYVMVDDPGWMSSAANPYTLTIERSWDPATLGPDDAPEKALIKGIWAVSRY